MMRAMGWLKDRPDFRDLTPDHEAVAPMLRYAGVVGTVAVPARVDLRQYCSEVPDQGALGSCTANAAAGLLEYSVRRAHGEPLVASRLFIYKATRRLMRVTGDITAESVSAALAEDVDIPGWFAPDLNCGAKAWPDYPSYCSAQMSVWQVEKKADGTLNDRVNETAERFGGIGPVDDIIAFIRADSSRAICQPKGANGG